MHAMIAVITNAVDSNQDLMGEVAVIQPSMCGSDLGTSDELFIKSLK
jgi:hypothetical protein